MLGGKKIGVVGAGNMGRALVSGLLHGKQVTKNQIIASHHRDEKAKAFAKEFGVVTTTDNREVVSKADIVVIAVKPQMLERVVKEIAPKVTAKKLIVSMAAGVPTLTIEKLILRKTRVVRAMPNVAVLVNEGATALAAGEHATEEDLKTACALFNAVGRTVVVEEEDLDAVTGLSGSGPAYIFLIIDALADAGVKMGLSRETSLILASQTVLGAAKLLIETDEHPGRLKDRVTSPGGTAIAGIHTLEEGGLRTTLINAVERATLRSKALGDIFRPKS